MTHSWLHQISNPSINFLYAFTWSFRVTSTHCIPPKRSTKSDVSSNNHSLIFSMEPMIVVALTHLHCWFSGLFTTLSASGSWIPDYELSRSSQYSSIFLKYSIVYSLYAWLWWDKLNCSNMRDIAEIKRIDKNKCLGYQPVNLSVCIQVTLIGYALNYSGDQSATELIYSYCRNEINSYEFLDYRIELTGTKCILVAFT